MSPLVQFHFCILSSSVCLALCGVYHLYLYLGPPGWVAHLAAIVTQSLWPQKTSRRKWKSNSNCSPIAPSPPCPSVACCSFVEQIYVAFSICIKLILRRRIRPKRRGNCSAYITGRHPSVGQQTPGTRAPDHSPDNARSVCIRRPRPAPPPPAPAPNLFCLRKWISVGSHEPTKCLAFIKADMLCPLARACVNMKPQRGSACCHHGRRLAAGGGRRRLSACGQKSSRANLQRRWRHFDKKPLHVRCHRCHKHLNMLPSPSASCCPSRRLLHPLCPTGTASPTSMPSYELQLRRLARAFFN